MNLQTKWKNWWLIWRFPFLKPYGYNNSFDYSGTLLDEIPIGGRKAFGIQLCEELKKELIKCDQLKDFEILEIKEKFGGMRFYTSAVSKTVQDIIDYYANKSFKICAYCGKPATQISLDGISPGCDACADMLKADNNRITFKPIAEYYKEG